jgi:hypothetical protein
MVTINRLLLSFFLDKKRNKKIKAAHSSALRKGLEDLFSA